MGTLKIESSLISRDMISKPILATTEKDPSKISVIVPSLHGLYLLKVVLSLVIWFKAPESTIYGFVFCFLALIAGKEYLAVPCSQFVVGFSAPYTVAYSISVVSPFVLKGLEYVGIWASIVGIFPLLLLLSPRGR